MNLRTVLLFLLLAAFAGFIALNWSVVTAPTTLHFGFWPDRKTPQQFRPRPMGQKLKAGG